MAAIFKNSKAITTMINSAGKSIVVSYVSETAAWKRNFLDQSVQNEFVQVAEKYKDDLTRNDSSSHKGGGTPQPGRRSSSLLSS